MVKDDTQKSMWIQRFIVTIQSPDKTHDFFM